MKFRLFLTLILVALLGTVMFSQISSVKAAAINGGGPISTPITSYKGYLVTGRVSYRLLGWFKPAANVTIEALNTQTRESFTTLTKVDGSYSLGVKDGSYKLRAFDSRNTIFTPLVSYVTGPQTLNFQGLLRLW